MNGNVNVTVYDDPKEFFQRVESILLIRESENNLILGLTQNIITGKFEPIKPIYLSISEDHKILGACLRTDPSKPLAISPMPVHVVAAIVHKLHQMEVELNSVVGESLIVQAFAHHWDKTAISPKLGMHQGIYQCDSVQVPALEGEMILAQSIHLDLLTQFSLGFIRDCFPDSKDGIDEAKKIAELKIQNRMAYLWKNSNNEIVALAAKNRESANGATVGWVYTPEEFRRNGYASMLVAKLTEKYLLSGKKFCNLFTDLANPTSNSIYQKIGYQKIGESMHLNFCE